MTHLIQKDYYTLKDLQTVANALLNQVGEMLLHNATSSECKEALAELCGNTWNSIIGVDETHIYHVSIDDCINVLNIINKDGTEIRSVELNELFENVFVKNNSNL